MENKLSPTAVCGAIFIPNQTNAGTIPMPCPRIAINVMVKQIRFKKTIGIAKDLMSCLNNSMDALITMRHKADVGDIKPWFNSFIFVLARNQ
ncbi:hypothetical protein GCM10011613_08650 [Cellvibrio zantedeschiae]|uniref:Uncharacterized protein n=1 Tax=Cellvibrio zantedeschiae TaxID=1237077 RepID=A0ABQ3AUL6_9GAMM|nr:hypothetical protein GCM10011613_08650 [Cellvibrio zantedeschiae]